VAREVEPLAEPDGGRTAGSSISILSRGPGGGAGRPGMTGSARVGRWAGQPCRAAASALS
jgi:hypothetical protein